MQSIEWMVARAGGLYLLLELCLAFTVLLWATLRPHWGAGVAQWIEQRFAGLANDPLRQILAVGALAVLLRAAMLPWLGAPAPMFHDEQSLLLQGQTFVAGRLANPTHPLWPHFETYHLSHVPAYASMYFPGRGAPLALGLLIADNAWVGVWISFVAMAMAAVWMLQGWVSLPLAFLGGVLVVMRLGVFSYWINSYWGGAFAAFGAMLVVGALPRLLAHPRWRHGVLMGLGAAILMNTRPYEGALLCLPVAVALLGAVVRSGWARQGAALVRSAIPMTIFVAAGGALLLAHNAATTGNPLKTPYELNRQAYATAPAFLISPPVQSEQRGPAYFRRLYEVEAENYERRGSIAGLARSAVGKFVHTANFYIGAPLGIAFLCGLWACRRNLFLLGAATFFMAGYLLETWNFPHYTSPIFPLLLILTMRGFDRLRWRQGRGAAASLALTRLIPAAVALLLLLPALAQMLGSRAFDTGPNTYACCALMDRNVRTEVLEKVRAVPGPHLVLVRDNAFNSLHYEMIYNEPDIDAAQIVWARRLGAEQDQRLLAHFAGRVLWEFEWQQGRELPYTLRRIP